MLAFGSRLLPDRAAAHGDLDGRDTPSVSAAELVDGYSVGELSSLRVRSSSPLIGRSPAQAQVRSRYGVAILRVRSGTGRRAVPWARGSSAAFCAGDVLDVQGSREAIAALQEHEGLAELLDRPLGSPLRMAEVLLTPRSRLIGQSLADATFRERYGLHVVSIRRMGEVLDSDLASTPLRFGDTLLVTGPASRIDLLRREAGDFVVVAQGKDESGSGGLSRRAYLATAVMIGMMILLTFDLVAPVTSVLPAAVLMVLIGALIAEEAYRSISWESVVLIAGILPMATALDRTGGMQLVVEQLGPLSALGPLAVGAALFVITSTLSQIISITATTVLVAPIAFRTALEMDVSPYSFLMIVAIAASTAFATPIASPVNTLVLGPGEYRFADFFRTGAALRAIILILALLTVPVLFPF